MALIKCPECGNEISSNAKVCVKCGCEITCCPECNTVYKGRIGTCSNCGYLFQKTEVSTNDNSLEEQTKLLEQQIKADVKIKKKTSIIMKIIVIGSFIFFAIGVFLYRSWKAKSGLQQLSDMNSLYSKLKFLSVAFCTVGLFSFFNDGFINFNLQIRRNNRLQSQKLNLKNYVFNYNVYDTQGDEIKTVFNEIKFSLFMNENPREKLYSIVKISLELLIIIVADICLSVWLIDNIKNMLAADLLMESYSWQFGVTSFIAAIAFLIGYMICWLFGSTPQEKRYKKWCADYEKELLK